MTDPASARIPVVRRSIRFEVEPGLSLAADVYGEPRHHPVVLLHGGGQTRFAWAGTAEGLARDGWYAIAVDLRGHGESDWAPDGDYGHSAFTQDVITLVGQLERAPVLVGASLGGIASLLATSRAQARLASALVLVDIAARMERGGAERIVEFMLSRPDGFASLEEAADAVGSYNPHRPRPRDLNGLRKNLRLGNDGRYRWHWDPRFLERSPLSDPDDDKGESGIHQPELLDAAARALDLPTLLVRGRLSDLLSEEGAQHFLDLVPHAKFADVSGAGHMVAGDRNDLFTAAVAGFLNDDVKPGLEEP